MQHPNSVRSHLFSVLCLTLIPALIYSRTFSAPFVFDDISHIVENPSLHMQGLSWDELGKVFSGLLGNRPVTKLTLALNYAFGGYSVWGYHVVNLLIHLLTAMVLYALLWITLRLPSLKERYERGARETALLSSLLWAVHPVQTQAVTYIVQRATSLVALFFLLTLLLYVRGWQAPPGWKRRLLYGGSLLTALLAGGSKETAVMLPVMLILYEVFFLLSFERQKIRARMPFFVLFFLCLLPLFPALYRGVLSLTLPPGSPGGFTQLDVGLTVWERIMTEWRVVIYYLSLLVFPLPSRLALDYGWLFDYDVCRFSISHSLLNPPTTLLSLMTIGGLLGAAVWRARRDPLLSYGVLWFFGNLAPESTIGVDVIFEHRLYLPSMGVAVLCAVAVERLLSRMVRKEIALKRVVVGGMVGLLCLGTVLRNEVWRDDVTLWKDAAVKYPCNPRAYYHLGFAYEKKGLLDLAREEYQRTLRLTPHYVDARLNLGEIYVKQGRSDLGIRELHEAIRLAPAYARAHYNLGRAYQREGRREEARAEYEEALRLKPRLVVARTNLGFLSLEEGNTALGIRVLQEAVRHDPHFAPAHLYLGLAYQRQGLLEEAIAESREALRLDPALYQAYYSIALAYASQGERDRAIELFEKFLSLSASQEDAASYRRDAEKRLRQLRRP